MADNWVVHLDERGVLRAEGPDLRDFLQGVITNDATRIVPDRAIWSALLTPQGKFLHEFFLVQAGEAILIDCEAARSADLLKRLSRYRLRANVDLSDISDDFGVAVSFGDQAAARFGLAPERGLAACYGGGTAFVDPRLPQLGVRLIAPKAEIAALAADASGDHSLETYEALRIGLGVPSGSRDLEIERSTLLENGFEELDGVSFSKGCFIGQELTARTKYRALIKKRLLPVRIDGPAPEPDTPVLSEGREVGVMRSAVGSVGLALLRLDRLAAGPLAAGDAQLRVEKPDWLHLTEPT